MNNNPASSIAAVLLRHQLRSESVARGKVYADMAHKIAWDLACCEVFRWWRL